MCSSEVPALHLPAATMTYLSQVYPTTRARRLIIKEFYKVRKEYAVTGSKLHRIIAAKLDYELDQNNDCSFVRRVIKEHLDSISADRPNQ